MPRPEPKRTDADSRTMRTKAGEVLTRDLVDAFAAEAEQGYDLTKAKRQTINEPEANPKGLTAVEPVAALYDDEELTDEDLRAVEEARREPRISWPGAEGS